MWQYLYGLINQIYLTTSTQPFYNSRQFQPFSLYTRRSLLSSMATAETVELGPSHKPKEASINAFNDLLSELKHELKRLRHEYDSRFPPPFPLPLSCIRKSLPRPRTNNANPSSLSPSKVAHEPEHF